MDFTLHSIIGLVGALGYLLSYTLLQMKRDYAKTVDYSLINLISASLVAFSLTKDFNAGSMFIQVMWIIISAYGVYRCMKYKIKKKKETALKMAQKTLEKVVEPLGEEKIKP